LERQALLGLARAALPSEATTGGEGGVAELQVTTSLRLQHRICGVLAGAGIREAAVAAVVMRVSDRAVLASASVPYGLDFAARGRIQPGSSLKPFILAAALESGFRLTDRFRSEESMLSFSDGRQWHVRNHEGRYHGEIDLCTALALSDNSVFAQLIRKLSMSHVSDVLGRFGLPIRDITPAVALGAVREGVGPLPLLNAYATIAAQGEMRPVRRILSSRDHAGESRSAERVAPERATTREVADLVAFALRCAASSGPAAIPIQDIAAKSGTADRDQVLAAFREDIAGLVWLGRPHGIHEVDKGFTPASLFQRLGSILFGDP
jgi:penicillin-binding protein 1A